MNVTKVKLLVDEALFGRVWFTGSIFYVTEPYRSGSSTVDKCDVFNDKGEQVGAIGGYYFDFGNKKVFERVLTHKGGAE